MAVEIELVGYRDYYEPCHTIKRGQLLDLIPETDIPAVDWPDKLIRVEYQHDIIGYIPYDMIAEVKPGLVACVEVLVPGQTITVALLTPDELRQKEEA